MTNDELIKFILEQQAKQAEYNTLQAENGAKFEKRIESIFNQQAQHNAKVEQTMQFILDQQAKAEVRQAQFEESTNKKIEFILDQQAKINTNVQLLTDIALTSALDTDHIKQEIREIKGRLDKAS